jgi:hypothetical protein
MVEAEKWSGGVAGEIYSSLIQTSLKEKLPHKEGVGD